MHFNASPSLTSSIDFLDCLLLNWNTSIITTNHRMGLWRYKNSWSQLWGVMTAASGSRLQRSYRQRSNKTLVGFQLPSVVSTLWIDSALWVFVLKHIFWPAQSILCESNNGEFEEESKKVVLVERNALSLYVLFLE